MFKFVQSDVINECVNKCEGLKEKNIASKLPTNKKWLCFLSNSPCKPKTVCVCVCVCVCE